MPSPLPAGLAAILFNALALLFLAAANPAAAEERIIRAPGLSTFGDLKYPADFKHFDYVRPDAPREGEFSTWAFGTFDSLTPYIRKGEAAALSTILYDTLMTGTADEPDAVYGLLAESVEYPESRQWIVFHLRPEARFSDGTPVTADDVVFSYEVLKTKGRPVYRVVFKDFETVEALDKHTVKFTFRDGALTRDLPLVAAGIPVFSRAYYATRDFAESSLEPPLGSGQYMVEKVDPGRSIVYRRRDDYWGKDLPVNVGNANFERIRLEYYGDYLSAFEGLKAGNYLFREEFSSKTWATAYDFPAIKKGWVKREVLPDGRPGGTQGFWINMRRKKFQDIRVRKALDILFNFEFTNNKLMYDQYDRTVSFWQGAKDLMAEGPIPPDEAALLEPFRADLPAEVFTEPAYVPPVWKKNRAVSRKAVREAGRLLDAAGWKVVEGKRRNAAGEILVVEFLNDSPTFEPHLGVYVDALKRAGIEATMRQVDPAQATERQKKFDFDIVIQRFVMSLTPGVELRRMFGSTAADLEASSNLSGLKNPAVDALIEKIVAAKSRAELDTAVRALDRVLRALHIWVPQWYKGTHTIAYYDVFRRPSEEVPPYSMGEDSFWWLDRGRLDDLRRQGALR
ncbi:MAG: ABC transporter substrate-binding protein [Alphaproteobacteria bacterium]|nr:MAG: ABC transporter substrate-binding protein [Alphaproteobacteria bacterium]